MLEKDSSYIWHPYTSLGTENKNLLVTSAKGVYLYISNGEKIIDAVSSWWVNLHGHSNAYINKALTEQAEKLEHVIFAGFTHEPGIQLAERLLAILPGNPQRIFYSDNGSTAVEAGIKMAFQYWHNQGIEKKKVLALNGAFHGDTFGAMAVGERGAFNNPFHTLLFESVYCDFPFQNKEEEVLTQFKSLCEDKEIAAFIYEPLLQGAGGMRMYSTEILEQMLQVAKKNEIICIADEVLTGFGRTGKLFASEYMKEKPDIICLSKGLTGGYLPMGVTSCNEKIIRAFSSSEKSKTFFHGHSYTGNPLCCAVALASLDLLENPSCQEQRNMIEHMHQGFKAEFSGLASIKEIRILGTVLAVELNTKEESGYFNSLRNFLYDFCLAQGVLLRPLGNVIYVLPPYIISKSELTTIYTVIKKVIQKIDPETQTF